MPYAGTIYRSPKDIPNRNKLYVNYSSVVNYCKKFDEIKACYPDKLGDMKKIYAGTGTKIDDELTSDVPVFGLPSRIMIIAIGIRFTLQKAP